VAYAIQALTSTAMAAAVSARLRDFRQAGGLAGGDFEALPRFGAEHASEVASVLAAQVRHAAAHGIQICRARITNSPLAYCIRCSKVYRSTT
jgi:hypothetical protein